MRARGLKQVLLLQNLNRNKVAPHAGAWIETISRFVYHDPEYVAPHAGAWIETDNLAVSQ